MKYREVGRKIRDYRHKLEMTQQELADRIGVTWEMVSRYERGANSPFSRIDSISEALKTTPSQLLQNSNNASEYRYFDIPLFTSIPETRDFSQGNTTFFYTAPKWIYELNTYVFAIESRLVKNKTLDIRDMGIVYISKEIIGENGIYISESNSEFNFTNNPENAIGQVIAQEVKYI